MLKRVEKYFLIDLIFSLMRFTSKLNLEFHSNVKGRNRRYFDWLLLLMLTMTSSISWINEFVSLVENSAGINSFEWLVNDKINEEENDDLELFSFLVKDEIQNYLHLENDFDQGYQTSKNCFKFSLIRTSIRKQTFEWDLIISFLCVFFSK